MFVGKSWWRVCTAAKITCGMGSAWCLQRNPDCNCWPDVDWPCQFVVFLRPRGTGLLYDSHVLPPYPLVWAFATRDNLPVRCAFHEAVQSFAYIVDSNHPLGVGVTPRDEWHQIAGHFQHDGDTPRTDRTCQMCICLLSKALSRMEHLETSAQYSLGLVWQPSTVEHDPWVLLCTGGQSIAVDHFFATCALLCEGVPTVGTSLLEWWRDCSRPNYRTVANGLAQGLAESLSIHLSVMATVAPRQRVSHFALNDAEVFLQRLFSPTPAEHDQQQQQQQYCTLLHTAHHLHWHLKENVFVDAAIKERATLNRAPLDENDFVTGRFWCPHAQYTPTVIRPTTGLPICFLTATKVCRCADVESAMGGVASSSSSSTPHTVDLLQLVSGIEDGILSPCPHGSRTYAAHSGLTLIQLPPEYLRFFTPTCSGGLLSYVATRVSTTELALARVLFHVLHADGFCCGTCCVPPTTITPMSRPRTSSPQEGRASPFSPLASSSARSLRLARFQRQHPYWRPDTTAAAAAARGSSPSSPHSEFHAPPSPVFVTPSPRWRASPSNSPSPSFFPSPESPNAELRTLVPATPPLTTTPHLGASPNPPLPLSPPPQMLLPPSAGPCSPGKEIGVTPEDCQVLLFPPALRELYHDGKLVLVSSSSSSSSSATSSLAAAATTAPSSLAGMIWQGPSTSSFFRKNPSAHCYAR